MSPPSVCFGAKDDSYGPFTTPISGNVITFKLIYLSGDVQCADGYQSHWGCCHPKVPQGFNMGTHITDSQKNRLLPKLNWRPCLYYKLPGLNPNSPVLLFDNFSIPRPVSAGDQFQIWFGEDLDNCFYSDNGGQTCAEVYGLFI